MPDIGQRKPMKLNRQRSQKAETEEVALQKKRTGPAPASNVRTKPQNQLIDDDEEDLEPDEDEDDDEIISESIRQRKSGSGMDIKTIVGIAAVVVVVVIAALLFLGSRSKNNEPVTDPNPPPVSEPNGSDGPTEPDIDDPSIGTQDFSKDTNNKSDSAMTDPENFTKDIYGLTTRVDYDVAQIQSAADFVNYTKCRGTWGGGLELYYLDAEYRGSHYVVQVPFKYYKELDDTGIVPVKMEVLRIKSDTSSDYLTIISYMSLDEATLQQVLKSQKK